MKTTMHHPPKKCIGGSCLNKILDLLTSPFSKVRNNYNNDPIVNFGSFGQNMLEH